MPLFGVDFLQLPRDFPEEVPFVVTRCTAEIEHRALGLQGIYRVSGSRVRVERLCQAFENGRVLVELSGNSPHDITSVLKRFLQEVGGSRPEVVGKNHAASGSGPSAAHPTPVPTSSLTPWSHSTSTTPSSLWQRPCVQILGTSLEPPAPALRLSAH